MDRQIDKKIRIVILGGGINSAVGRAHLSALSIDRHFELVGGCFSLDNNERIDSINEYKLGKSFKDYSSLDEIIQDSSSYDLVLNLTPTTLHFSTNSKIASAGINFISEKAISTSFAEADALADLCKKSNVYSAVVFNYCAYPAVKHVTNMINSGELGEIVSVELSMHQEGYLRETTNKGVLQVPQSWRLESPSIPMVSLDLGVHLLALTEMFGIDFDLSSINSHNSFNSRLGVVDTVYTNAYSDIGFPISLIYGKSFLGNRNGLQFKIYGKESSVHWKQVDPENLTCAYSDGKISLIDRSVFKNHNKYERFKIGHPSGFVEALANFYLDVFYDYHQYLNNDDRDGNYFSMDIARKGMQILDKISK